MATPKFLTAPNCPNIGEMLKHRIKERKIFKSALGRHLKRSASTIQEYTKRPTLQVAILWDLATALKHNFFLDLAAQLPPEFTTYVASDTTKDERIAALEQEVLLLNEKLELLKEVMGKGGS